MNRVKNMVLAAEHGIRTKEALGVARVKSHGCIHNEA